MQSWLRGLFFLMLVCVQQSAFAAQDARMQVDVIAEQQGVEVRWLHANIQKAADMALPQLWDRIIPQHALAQIPKKVKAVRFLQKAVPNEQGVSIIFNEKRVLRYLKKNAIPYYVEQTAEQSADNVAITPTMMQPSIDVQPGLEPLVPPSSQKTGLLTVLRQASLPEQVLFEDDLARDPRIIRMTLRQVNSGEQQYRLQLKGPDDRWLSEWFRQRGLMLTQSVEGWVAR